MDLSTAFPSTAIVLFFAGVGVLFKRAPWNCRKTKPGDKAWKIAQIFCFAGCLVAVVVWLLSA